MRSASVVSMMLLVGGCTSDDPSKGGFFGGLAGLGSGSYEQRIADRTASWNADERRYQEEVVSKNDLDATVRERHYQVTDLELQVAELKGDIATLNADIETLQAEKTVTSGDLAKAENTIASLRDDIVALRALQAAQERAAVSAAEAVDSESGANVDGGLEGEDTIELRAYITELDKALEALKSVRARRAGETVLQGAVVTD